VRLSHHLGRIWLELHQASTTSRSGERRYFESGTRHAVHRSSVRHSFSSLCYRREGERQLPCNHWQGSSLDSRSTQVRLQCQELYESHIGQLSGRQFASNVESVPQICGSSQINHGQMIQSLQFLQTTRAPSIYPLHSLS
jgi:hypothetical protein